MTTFHEQRVERALKAIGMVASDPSVEPSAVRESLISLKEEIIVQIDALDNENAEEGAIDLEDLDYV